MPTLLLAQADVRRGVLEEERQTRIRDMMRSLVEDLAEDGPFDGDEEDKADVSTSDEAPPTAAETSTPDDDIDESWRADGAILCLAGRTPLDEAAALLIALLLRRHGLGVSVASADTLTQPEETAPHWPEAKLVLLSFLDADLRLAQARFAIRRLRPSRARRADRRRLLDGGDGPRARGRALRQCPRRNLRRQPAAGDGALPRACRCPARGDAGRRSGGRAGPGAEGLTRDSGLLRRNSGLLL